jgi:membrane protease YdiL (CAAX protease family)
VRTRAIKCWLADFFGEPLRRVGDEQRDFLASDASRRTDWQVIAVLVTAAVTLTIQYYGLVAANKGGVLERTFGFEPPRAIRLSGPDTIADWGNWRLLCLSYWALGQTLVYVAAPLVVVKLVFRQPLEDYGVKQRGVFGCWPAYALMFLAILPGVLYVSQTSAFQQTYPFYRLGPGEPLWPRLFVWEVLYAVQFFALEFFFRGFVLHGVRRRFGVYSIFVMTVPYCMIHFGKPMLETFAAIAAGIILGFMSLKTRSIWMGAVLHVAVAWTMDAAAIWRRAMEG